MYRERIYLNTGLLKFSIKISVCSHNYSNSGKEFCIEVFEDSHINTVECGNLMKLTRIRKFVQTSKNFIMTISVKHVENVNTNILTVSWCLNDSFIYYIPCLIPISKKRTYFCIAHTPMPMHLFAIAQCTLHIVM